MVRNKKAFQRLIVAVELVAAGELVNVANSVVRPSDCACDHARIAPLPADFPGPEERPEMPTVAFDRTPSAGSSGTLVSAISTVSLESRGHVSAISTVSLESRGYVASS